ncbi:ABC transporter permease subunit/CPBP intramembrane protease [Lignipirellula cremea]|uniref:ABC-2 family transporter protein n=1 Tax=Lignipirellula cremea TaxID=2528010 RepID=A0A518DWH9_9BACT|nr:ABC transporter permease subunit/CPBP intramembrane protease [Lignipirellula cremea]QDU96188.1 ABC-2 family transporter protein [Lignipirellula cremea]
MNKSASPRLSTWRRLRGLMVKELRETLRDRRTIITLVLMPVLVYPLFGLICQKFLLTSGARAVSEPWRLGIASDNDEIDPQKQAVFEELLRQGARLLYQKQAAAAAATPGDAPPAAAPANPPPPSDPPKPTASGQPADSPQDADLAPAEQPEPDNQRAIELMPVKDIRVAVAEGLVDAAVDLKIVNGERQVKIYYRPASSLSGSLRRYLSERLIELNLADYQNRLRHFRLPAAPLTDVRLEEIEGKEPAPVSLAGVVPLILILMTITGAVYPAIDCTAGERERGTLETLAASPAPRLYILLAKYVAVLTVALLTAAVNLLAMTITVNSLGLGSVLLGAAGFSIGVIGSIFGLMVLFAAFFSAVLLCVTSFARSFKEAQAYLIPLMMLSIGPGLVSLSPEIRLTPLLAACPLINIVLLARDVMEGSVNFPLAMMTITTTVFFALAAIGLAAKLFGSDAVLYGAPGGWAELFQRPAKSRSAASVSSAMLCLAILFPLLFLTANLLARWKLGGDDPTQLSSVKFLLNGLATLVLFGLLPTFAAWLQRVRIRDGFQVHTPILLSWPLAILLGVSLWPLAHELVVLAHQIGIASLSPEQMEQTLGLVEKLRQVPLWVTLLSFALAPAVFEEWFFRGYLMRAFLATTSRGNALLFSSLLFGLFHVVSSSLAFERFLPTTCLGLVLGYVCLRTGSVLPGMLLHVTHNSLIWTAAYERERLAAWGLSGGDTDHLPLVWLVVAGTTTLVALVLLTLTTRPPAPSETEEPIL